MSVFRMPSLGADMDEGTVLEWLVRPGDVVQKGDIVAVVDTAKSAVDVETFDGGVVQSILVEVGEKVPVGTPLAEIAAAGAESAGTGPAEPGSAEPEPAKSEPEPAKRAPAKRAPAKHPGRGKKRPRGAPAAPVAAEPAAAAPKARPDALASPVVRHFAHTSGVDLAAVHGTGPGGRITHDDVQRAAASAQPDAAASAQPDAAASAQLAAAAPTGGRARVSPYARRRARELGVDPADLVAAALGSGPVTARAVEAAASASGRPGGSTRRAAPTSPAAASAATGSTAAERAAAMRAAIATLMSRSKREVPHYYLTETFDLSTAAEWLRRRNEGLPVRERLVMAALLAKATAVAARRVPQLNGFWLEDGFRPAESVHLGVAVSLRGGGLVTPAIHDADTVALPDLMAALRDVVERARRGVLHRAELTDGTLTMTNLGERGAESVLGVIFPPQVALVGFGRVVERPMAVGGLIGVHPTVAATLSADHRASDGHVGGTFLAAIGELLERPEDL